MMFPPSAHRVPIHTNPVVNDQIQRRTESRLCFYAEHPERISQRLRALDREWDIERILEAWSSAITLFGLFRAVRRRRAWLLLPLAVQSFFLQHALLGWCPPVPWLRRLGFRAQAEVDRERYALKAVHGDFRRLEEIAHNGRGRGRGSRGLRGRRALELV